MKIKLDDATPAQVREYARVSLGLEVSDNAQKAAILSKMADVGFSDDEIEVTEPAPEEDKAKPKAKASDPEEVVTIYIEETEEGDQNVPVFVNGVGVNIPRGKEWPVKRKYLDALDNAVTRKPIIDTETSVVKGFREVRRFNYRIVD